MPVDESQLTPDNRQNLTALAPGLLATAIFVALGIVEGGHPETVWYPAAIVLLGLLAAVLLGGAAVGAQPPVELALAVLGFGVFTLWSFATIFWAADREIALDGSTKTLLYFTSFALFAWLPWRRSSATFMICTFVLATTVVAAWFFVVPDVDDSSSRPFLFGRLADPVGYPNGNAALLFSAFWPALVLASRREVPVVLRTALLAAAGGLLQLVIATQSRGAAVAATVTVLIVFLVVPGRLRILGTLVPVGIVAGWMTPRLLRLGDLTLTDQELQAAVADARAAFLLSLAALGLLGAVTAVAEKRFALPGALTRRSSVTVGVVALTATLIVAAWSLGSSTSTLIERVRDARSSVGGSRFSERQVDGGRVELWRVGLDEFRRHPIVGIGVDNFAVPYARERQVDDEEPLYPHSLVVKIASQTGLVGSLIFLGFLASAALAVTRAWRADAETRAVVVAAALPATYWSIHGSIDWLWELPALSLPALGFLALAGGVDRNLTQIRTSIETKRRFATYSAAVACLTSTLILVPLWLSAREVELAGGEWRLNPASAFTRLDRAARLNPLADTPAVTAGAIASRRRDFRSMATSYSAALERNSHNWYAHLQLAVAYSLTGRKDAALRSIRRARQLNPLERILVTVERQLQNGKRPDPRAIDAYFLEQARDLIR